MLQESLDMYLGLSEAYGMYTVLSFLQCYLASFPLSKNDNAMAENTKQTSQVTPQVNSQ